MTRYPIPEEQYIFQENVNLITTVLLLVELIMQIWGKGLKNYFSDNKFDFFVVIVSITDECIEFDRRILH